MILLRMRHSKESLSRISEIALSKDVYRELGYPIFSDESHVWYMVYIDKKLVGISSIVNKGRYVSFNHAYVLPEYRGNGIYRKMLRERLNDCVCVPIKVVATKKSLNELLKNQFKITKQTTNYYFLEL
jgi:GNAT superfamily N-acetyltransferase